MSNGISKNTLSNIWIDVLFWGQRKRFHFLVLNTFSNWIFNTLWRLQLIYLTERHIKHKWKRFEYETQTSEMRSKTNWKCNVYFWCDLNAQSESCHCLQWSNRLENYRALFMVKAYRIICFHNQIKFRTLKRTLNFYEKSFMQVFIKPKITKNNHIFKLV